MKLVKVVVMVDLPVMSSGLTQFWGSITMAESEKLAWWCEKEVCWSRILTFEGITESGHHRAMAEMHPKGADHQSRQPLPRTSAISYESHVYVTSTKEANWVELSREIDQGNDEHGVETCGYGSS